MQRESAKIVNRAEKIRAGILATAAVWKPSDELSTGRKVLPCTALVGLGLFLSGTLWTSTEAHYKEQTSVLSSGWWCSSFLG